MAEYCVLIPLFVSVLLARILRVSRRDYDKISDMFWHSVDEQVTDEYDPYEGQ